MSDIKDFFISYNKADREWAEWIAWQLEEAGYTTVIQAWDFRGGGNFALDMHDAARGTRRTIGVLSPDYLKSEYTAPEWAAAFAKDPTGKQRAFVPVRVRECKPDGLLAQIVYIDLVGILEPDQAKNLLLNEVKTIRPKPLTPPPFPGRIPETKPAIPLPERAKPASAPSFPTGAVHCETVASGGIAGAGCIWNISTKETSDLPAVRIFSRHCNAV